MREEALRRDWKPGLSSLERRMKCVKTVGGDREQKRAHPGRRARPVFPQTRTLLLSPREPSVFSHISQDC